MYTVAIHLCRSCRVDTVRGLPYYHLLLPTTPPCHHPSVCRSLSLPPSLPRPPLGFASRETVVLAYSRLAAEKAGRQGTERRRNLRVMPHHGEHPRQIFASESGSGV